METNLIKHKNQRKKISEAVSLKNDMLVFLNDKISIDILVPNKKK